MGENEQQWEELARLVQEAGADMIECNFSCPQMTSHAMGSDVGQSPELVEKYCRAVKRGSTLPMLAKMTPNIGDMCEVALAAKRGGFGRLFNLLKFLFFCLPGRRGRDHHDLLSAHHTRSRGRLCGGRTVLRRFSFQAQYRAFFFTHKGPYQ